MTKHLSFLACPCQTEQAMPSEEHKYHSASAVPAYHSTPETKGVAPQSWNMLGFKRSCITTKTRKAKLFCVSFPTLYTHLCWDRYLYATKRKLIGQLLNWSFNFFAKVILNQSLHQSKKLHSHLLILKISDILIIFVTTNLLNPLRKASISNQLQQVDKVLHSIDWYQSFQISENSTM